MLNVIEEKAWSHGKMKDMLRLLGARIRRNSFLGWSNDQWNAVGDWAYYQLEEQRTGQPAPKRYWQRPACADPLFTDPPRRKRR